MLVTIALGAVQAWPARKDQIGPFQQIGFMGQESGSPAWDRRFVR